MIFKIAFTILALTVWQCESYGDHSQIQHNRPLMSMILDKANRGDMSSRYGNTGTSTYNLPHVGIECTTYPDGVMYCHAEGSTAPRTFTYFPTWDTYFGCLLIARMLGLNLSVCSSHAYSNVYGSVPYRTPPASALPFRPN